MPDRCCVGFLVGSGKMEKVLICQNARHDEKMPNITGVLMHKYA
jgi:hypothetical protein